MDGDSKAPDVPEEVLCPPISDPSIVTQFLKDHYGLVTTSLTPLNGYDDRNYQATVEPEHTNPHIQGISLLGYFVKVCNAMDSAKPGFLGAQMCCMDHLHSHGITCQSEIKNLDGQFFSSITLSKNGVESVHVATVRTFLPGNILASQESTPPLLYEVGVYMARIHKAFEGFEEPFYETFDCLWSMDNMLKVRSAVHAVKNDNRCKLVEDILNTFEADVLPRRSEFRKGQIHGDPNDQNILIDKDPNTASGVTFSGLLDFQECALSHPIYDLCMLTAYMMMLPNTKVPPVDAAAYVLAGYSSMIQTNRTERECIRTLTASRMTMSLVYGALTHMLDPSNTYVLLTSKVGWDVLTSFWQMPMKKVEERWKEVAQTYKYNDK